MSSSSLSEPILNRPYDIPDRYFEIGPKGPTGVILDGRRPSESFIPIAGSRKGQQQVELDFEGTAERREKNDLINDLRREVELWRAQGYPRVTAITRNLLLHWSDSSRENRVLFCQREAVETAIFLHEVAGREQRYAAWQGRLEADNVQHNDGLPRVALKMATGSGKTVVMAMLIAWHTLNKVMSPRDARFTKRFLVVTPGITIRDRLRVLQPGSPGNYFDERDLVPADLRNQLGQARVVITNYHSFLPKLTKEFVGVAKTTREILRNGRAGDPFSESDDAVVARVLRGLGAESGGQVVVLNDEAHHCYRDRPIETTEAKTLSADEKREAKLANEDARVWFKGLQAVKRSVGIKTVFDLSATPYYLKGSGYHESFIFPWTVSDFSLMDAIESGIVKVPRIPTDDDAEGDTVRFRDLWVDVGEHLGKRRLSSETSETWVMPAQLESALRALYRNYEKAWAHWEQHLEQHGEPPPVFIVVCPNTEASRLIHEWISGHVVERDGAQVHTHGNLPLFSNAQDGAVLDRTPTILVDSVQLESGEPLKGDFKKAAAAEIERFKSEMRRRNPGADVDSITDAELLREVLNTVGKKGRLGEQVRCVVSVAMLTEGWDANTVSHILGIRAFRSQLLCEQVVGRGLRRRSYELNEEEKFDAEYANVFGIPFQFIPSDTEIGPEPEPRAAIEVASLADRGDYRIRFPILDGYRTEVPDAGLILALDDAPRMTVGLDSVPRTTTVEGIAGAVDTAEYDTSDIRVQSVAFKLAERLLKTKYADGEDERRWYYPRLVSLARQWLDSCVDVDDGYDIGKLTLAEPLAEAAELLHRSINLHHDRRPRVRAMLRRSEHTGSTDDVWFITRKVVHPTLKSQVSHVVLDGRDGNTWEQLLANECEISPHVQAYVKNDHLGFAIPYTHKGRSHSYLPDFLLKLRRPDGEDFDRFLIVEVSGGQKSPGPTKEKAATAHDLWCPAVNNHGGFGRWGYVEVTSMDGVRVVLEGAIESHYADGAVIGAVDAMDFGQTRANEVLGGS